MTKLEKYLTAACLAMTAAGVLAVRARWPQSAHGQTVVETVTPTAPDDNRVPDPTSPSSADAGVNPSTLTVTADSPADDTRNELLNLSGLVNLASAPYAPPDRDQWRQALPIAKELVRGTCDCAQRSWLNTFIEMGAYALADDEENYRKHGEIIVTLGRNNDESAAFLREQHDLAERGQAPGAVN